MIHAGVGLSRKLTNHREAGGEAVQLAIAKLPSGKPHLVILFSSIQYNQEDVLAGAQSRVPDVPIVGGSAAGEIISTATVFDGVAALAIESDQIRFTISHSEGVSKNSFDAAARTAKQVLAKSTEKIKLFISLPDGITGDGSAIVNGTQSILGDTFPIIGGSLGDDYLFKKTFEYCDGKVLTDSIIGIGLSGDFSFGFGIQHGWEAVGLPMRVTKAHGTLLQEVDGKPALSIYQDYFGKDAYELIKEPLARMAYTYPLGIKVEGAKEYLIRDPIVANGKGEITMAAAIPEGSIVQLMIGDRDKALGASRSAAETALKQLEGRKPRLILMFNCMARNKLLGVRCSEENQIVQDIIGRDVPMLGLYTYGEQGPLAGVKGMPAYFYNETMTLVVIGE